MKKTVRSRLLFWVPVASSWAAVLLIAASILGLWVLLSEESPRAFWTLAVPLGLGAVVGVAGRRSRVRMRRRLQAALDAYAEREIKQLDRRWIARRRVRTLSTALGLSGMSGVRLKPGLGNN